jgi:hypothetical protein
MGYFAILVRIQAASTSLQPELISLRIEESISGRGEEPVQVEDRINWKRTNCRFQGAESVQVEECFVASRPEPTLKLADG